MEEINKIIRGEERKKVKEGLAILLNKALDNVGKIASSSGPGEDLFHHNSGYFRIYGISKNFLNKKELEKIDRRYKLIRELWL